MRTTGEVRWCASLDEDERGETAAWIVVLGDGHAGAGALPAPNAVDLAEIGARRGIAADQFLLRRLTLRRLVARWCGVPVETVVVGYDAAGRPAVRRPAGGPHCSVTARGEIAGFALSEAAVGIDLEPVGLHDIPWAVLSPSEEADLLSLGGRERGPAFLELWTVKEAYLKALGTGLLRDPASVTISRHERHVQDGDQSIRLPASALRYDSSGSPPVVAACVSLPSRAA